MPLENSKLKAEKNELSVYGNIAFYEFKYSVDEKNSTQKKPQNSQVVLKAIIHNIVFLIPD